MIGSCYGLIQRARVQDVVWIHELLDLFHQIVKIAEPLIRMGSFRAEGRRGPDNAPLVAELLHHSHPTAQLADILFIERIVVNKILFIDSQDAANIVILLWRSY